MAESILNDLQIVMAHAKCNGTICSECPIYGLVSDCNDVAILASGRIQLWLDTLPAGGICNITVDDLL